MWNIVRPTYKNCTNTYCMYSIKINHFKDRTGLTLEHQDFIGTHSSERVLWEWGPLPPCCILVCLDSWALTVFSVSSFIWDFRDTRKITCHHKIQVFGSFINEFNTRMFENLVTLYFLTVLWKRRQKLGTFWKKGKARKLF